MFYVTGLGADVAARAYAAIGMIDWPGGYRLDIGWPAKVPTWSVTGSIWGRNPFVAVLLKVKLD